MSSSSMSYWITCPPVTATDPCHQIANFGALPIACATSLDHAIPDVLSYGLIVLSRCIEYVERTIPIFERSL